MDAGIVSCSSSRGSRIEIVNVGLTINFPGRKGGKSRIMDKWSRDLPWHLKIPTIYGKGV
jgi:hypothetical protein